MLFASHFYTPQIYQADWLYVAVNVCLEMMKLIMNLWSLSTKRQHVWSEGLLKYSSCKNAYQDNRISCKCGRHLGNIAADSNRQAIKPV